MTIQGWISVQSEASKGVEGEGGQNGCLLYIREDEGAYAINH